MKTVGILYVCTGGYVQFWNDFFLSASKFFQRGSDCRLKYYVFTDAPRLAFDDLPQVCRIPLVDKTWPDITLLRYHFFLSAARELSDTDCLYFFNANIRFMRDVGMDFLPSSDRPLVLVRHPGYLDADTGQLPYSRDTSSTACVGPHEGQYYFLGGINGGETARFLQMAAELRDRIDQDRSNGVLATWHDESHLNRYAIDHAPEIKVLGAEYGFPEGYDLPVTPRILIRDKREHGGHDYLRGNGPRLRRGWRRWFRWS